MTGFDTEYRASALSKNPDFSIGRVSKIRIFGLNADVLIFVHTIRTLNYGHDEQKHPML